MFKRKVGFVVYSFHTVPFKGMVLGAFTDFFWIGQAGQVNVRNDAFVLSASPRYPVEFSLGKFDLATTEIAESLHCSLTVGLTPNN